MTNYLSIFKFSCSTTNGVDILVLGLRFRCNCEGEEVSISHTGCHKFVVSLETLTYWQWLY